MKLLVIGHALIIDANRTFWGVLAQKYHASVDVIAPKRWSSNLKNDIPFLYNPQSDSEFRQIFTLKAFFKGNGSLYFFNPISLLKIFWRNKYDVIYLNQETWALSTLVLILIKLFSPNRKAKLFLCVAQNLKKERLKFLHPYERLVSKFVCSFLYCSEEVKEVLRWKGITSSFTYFPLPYDDSKYKSALPDIDQPLFRLGYLGRLSDEKGLNILLAACDELKKNQFPFKLIIGGSGPLSEEIQSRDYVEFLGLIPHNEAHTFYERIDCFILPSQTRSNWKEQFGRVIVESFGAGRPVIGSSSGSIPEVLGKLKWPWIFSENSSLELASLIIKLRNELKSTRGQEELRNAIKLNYQQFSQSEVAKTLYHSFE